SNLPDQGMLKLDDRSAQTANRMSQEATAQRSARPQNMPGDRTGRTGDTPVTVHTQSEASPALSNQHVTQSDTAARHLPQVDITGNSQNAQGSEQTSAQRQRELAAQASANPAPTSEVQQPQVAQQQPQQPIRVTSSPELAKDVVAAPSSAEASRLQPVATSMREVHVPPANEQAKQPTVNEIAPTRTSTEMRSVASATHQSASETHTLADTRPAIGESR
ncbi:MAG: hypothetical protein ACREJM_00020, partial [Candidatus Saccharimonadales bacterium]